MVGRAKTPEGEDKRRKAISDGAKRNAKARKESTKDNKTFVKRDDLKD